MVVVAKIGEINVPQSVEKPITINSVARQFCDFDFSPPYQRGDVWEKINKQKLIGSIINGIPIGTTHLVKYDNCIKKYILDGKQRLTTIKDFIDNKFSIELEVDGEILKMKWDDLMTSDKDEIRDISNRINDYHLSVMLYEPMTIEKQRKLFETINYSAKLNNNEEIYCLNFHVKYLLEDVYRSCFNAIAHNFKDAPLKENKRYITIRLIHQILFLAFGKDFEDDMMHVRETGKNNINNSAKIIQKKFLSINHTSDKKIDNETMKKIKIYNNLALFRKVCFVFNDILEYHTVITKKLNKIDVQDFLVFLIYKIQTKVLTVSYIKANLELFNKVFFDYVLYKNVPVNTKSKSDRIIKTYKNNTSSANRIHDRMEILETIFNSVEGIDRNVKNKKISLEEEIKLRNSIPICVKCGKVLTNDDFSIDHKIPKSLSDCQEGQLMCKTCNRQKGNNVEVCGIEEELLKEEDRISKKRVKSLF